jgi:hypothetical protein
VDFRIFCTIHDRQAPDIGKVVLRINGKQVGTDSCDQFQETEPGERAVREYGSRDPVYLPERIEHQGLTYQ